MHNRISKILFTVLSVLFLCTTIADAADKDLSLVSGSGSDTIEVNVDDPIIVEVKIDDASVVAGASFTINYDTNNLQLSSVESTFFGTFVDQSIPTPNDQGYVTVDTDYYSPIVDNTVSGLDSAITTGSMLAAARVDNGAGTNITLFTLTFELIGTPGTFPVTITQSKINNVSAGYSASGDLIPYLVGIDGSSYPTHNVPSPIGCTIVIFVDTDHDGIDDNWEVENRPDLVAADDPNVLTYFTIDGDYDKDGYSDYQEYLNRNETDLEDAAYDPKVKNAPGGTGYVSITKGYLAIPAINYLLLMTND